ncbi:MAG TPA: stage II sporulation protein E (SpoIIE) [Chloroflexi bacterium]|nr:stage II sporulation protein E (SpoIIE) [Chloroflexota bacterium]
MKRASVHTDDVASDAHTVDRSLIEWGVAGRAFDGESESGDQYLIESFANGALVVVVDGLGHGPRAAAAAKAAIAALDGYTQGSVSLLLKKCHDALRRTRGVVMSLASFDIGGTMTWLGVGNVKGLLLYQDEHRHFKRERLLLRGGVVGYNLPTLRPATVNVRPGDTLILATDGLCSVFAEELTMGDYPQQMADTIMEQYRRGTDDALVLVARYVGPSQGA